MVAMEKRIVALDIGDRRIGIAVSDPFNSYAMPSETYCRTRDFRADVAAVARIAAGKDAGLIVCGLPVHADGTPSAQTEKAAAFIEALREETQVPVVTEDERFTSLEAHETLHQEGYRARKHKKNVDSVAASYILETYLQRCKKEKDKE